MTQRRTQLLFDAAVALAVTAATIGMVHGEPIRDDGAGLDALAVVLAGVAGLPLALRHRRPLAVLGVSTAGGAALALFGYAPVVQLPTAVALFTVGAGISLITNRGMARSGLRQLGVGAIAAAGTYAVGRVVDLGLS